MIKHLRIKFICVIMAIVMIMLSVILGVVIHFTGVIMEMQSVSMMRTIAATPFQLENLGKGSGEVRLPFFIVKIGNRGEVVAASGGYFDLSNREFVQEIVDEASSTDAEVGELVEYNLRYLKSSSVTGQSIIFSDTSTEQSTLRNMLYICVGIFVAAGLVFFGISILLSQWAVKPVESAWTRQRQFVADASHELKTPLSVIMANAELLQGDGYSEPERKNFSQSILTMTYQMRALVENLLEMARMDNGTAKMRFTNVDFSQLVSDAVLSFQLLYEEKGMGLCCDMTEGVHLAGSEQHLYQVLDVLLDNALKYSTPGGTVRVSLKRHNRCCLLSVASPGEPIAREDLKNIFERFYRGDKARTMNGSYGLGLAIAKSVVDSHKGKIWAECQDGYNVFYVMLPMAFR